MKLGIKIILPILFLILIILGTFGYFLYNLNQQEAAITKQGLNIQKLNGLNERLSRQQEQTEINVITYRLNQDRTLLLAISQTELDKSKTLDEMSPFIITPRGRELVSSYIDARKEIESLRNELIKAIDGGDKEQINLHYNKWNIQTQNIKAALADIETYNINSLEKTLVSVKDISDEIAQIIIVLGFVVIVTVLFLYFYLRTVITAPIVKLAQFADEIANKNFTTTTTTTGINSKDEIGMLSRSFNTMSVKLKESYEDLEQKVAVRTKQLELAKAKDETMLSSIGDGVFAIDTDEKIILFNKAASQMSGYSPEEALGKPYKEILRFVLEKDVSISDEFIKKALNGNKAEMIKDTLLVRKDGQKIAVADTAAPIFDENKQIMGVVVIVRDVSKERQVERMKTEFVSIASHQLRTPLTAIKWYSKMLLDGDAGEPNKKQKEYLEEIRSGNGRMVALVNSLLNVSRIELGTFTVQLEKINIITICKEVTQEVKEEIASKQLAFKEEFTKISDIEADPNYIRIIFQNLITNAIKYTPDKGAITVSISENSTDLLISVKDTGYGIPEKAKEKIFTKFYRADNVLTKDTDGTGLGLYITKSVVEQVANGKIWFESSENKGTTFFVSLPLTGMIEREGVKGIA